MEGERGAVFGYGGCGVGVGSSCRAEVWQAAGIRFYGYWTLGSEGLLCGPPEKAVPTKAIALNRSKVRPLRLGNPF